MEEISIANYIEAVKIIKEAILTSRYNAIAHVNKEQLSLYFNIGKYISDNTRNKNWGNNALEMISKQLQQELTNLRGFS